MKKKDKCIQPNLKVTFKECLKDLTPDEIEKTMSFVSSLKIQHTQLLSSDQNQTNQK